MTPVTRINVASVSKTMTAIATLQLLAANNLTPDMSILNYLYPDWQPHQLPGGTTSDPNVAQITFRELLAHTSGFAQSDPSCGYDVDYSRLQTMVANGVPNPANIGGGKHMGSYGNCNFALLRELFPALLGQAATIQALPVAQRPAASSKMYVEYLNRNVFEVAGIGDRSCAPATDGSNALGYQSVPVGSAHGDDFGDNSLYCGSTGWQLSASDIFRVANSIAVDTKLLSVSLKHQMTQGCLGWDCAVGEYCPDPYVCKNGELGGSGVVRTYAGILQCDVPVAVLMNSQSPSGSDPIGIVAGAFGKAQVAGTPVSSCPANAGNVQP
jgi:CubicO group peptidase (beta-lactamase class C family)